MSHRTDLNGLDWLTVSQAAEYAGVSPSTILRYEKAGAISASRTLGGHRRFRREEVAELLKAAS